MQPDHLEENDYLPNKQNPVFSKLAFAFAILSPALIIVAIAKFSRIKAFGGDRTLFIITGRLGLLSMLLGLLFSIISLYRREKLKYLKPIAAIINIGIFLILLFIVAFALVIDWKRLHH